MKRFSDFQNLTSQELAANESFQAYVRGDKDEIVFWETFISMYPEKRTDVAEAAEILNLISFRQNATPSGFKESELNRLLLTIRQEATDTDIVMHGKSEPFAGKTRSMLYTLAGYRPSRIAASLAGFLIVCSIFSYFHFSRQDSPVMYRTAYGQNNTVVLPDSSIVTLNGNTRLTHSHDWENHKTREVWLDGEAFFEVKNNSKTRFVVHTPGMDVEVLGTKFNVFNRDDKAHVVLNSGKVKIRISSESDTSSLLMKPDESVEFYRKDNTITKRQVKAEALTSWRNKILVFENTPLHKIKEMIEYTYGVKVILTENVNAAEGLVGTIPNDNLEVLLTVLAKSSNLQITRDNDKIIIDKNGSGIQQLKQNNYE